MKTTRLFVTVAFACSSIAAGCADDSAMDAQETEDYWEVYPEEYERADIAVDPASRFDCAALDTGIYWYGTGNQSQKHVAGVANPYYDPTRPTVIYAHGWQPGSSEIGRRESFNYQQIDRKNGLDVDMADAWRDAGWNIGIFYWNQFSDEGDVKDAEAKIWSAQGPRGMRWRKCDGSYTTDGSPAVSAGELFYQAYTAALADFSGPVIRLAGHSLGSQMVVRLTGLVQEGIAAGQIPDNLLPTRVALLDPFWSRGGKSYLGNRWTGEVARDRVVSAMAEGVLFERYKSSNINDFFVGDKNTALTDRIGEVDMVPDYISLFDQSGRHRAAMAAYFYGVGFDAPAGCRNGSCTSPVPSSATTDSDLRTLMQVPTRWSQSKGRDTFTPDDDEFTAR